MGHHNIKDQHLINHCIYCGETFQNTDWKSEFWSETHYKATSCKVCKHTTRLKVSFGGCGHDAWSGVRIMPRTKGPKLEKRISSL